MNNTKTTLHMKRLFLAAAGFLFPLLLAAQAVLPYQNPSLSPEKRAKDLVGRLNLEQKVTLMMDQSAAVPEFGIRKYNWWNEALHGTARAGLATMFPQVIGMAASFDDALLQQVYDIASTEHRIKYILARQKDNVARYHGLTVWTPNINIFRDPRWGRGQETYGEDPYLTMRMGYAVVNGLQGTGSGEKYDKLHACLKHFAVHSGPESERHSFDAADVSYRDLMETYLFAFENLVKTTDVKEVMCAYNSFEGDPCCGSDKLLIQFLRRDWGYKGIVVSDCGAINDFFVPGRHDAYPNDPASATAKAVLTGTDLECGSSYKALLDAVKQGKIKESDIDVSVTRLLKARFELGEMDDDSLVSWNSIPVSKLACDEHDAVALQMARETMTLLQNRGNVLPLAKEGKRYAVLGPNAADSTVLWGNYNGTPRKTVTVLEAIRAKVGTRNVFYADPASSLLATPAGVDAYIFVGGISPRLEGEEMRVSYEGFAGGDRTSIELPAIQREMLKLLRKTGKPVIFVNMSGSAIALEPETQSCDAILQAWYGGQEGGQAVADVLFGDYNPAGRLPVTFYRNDAQLPDFHDYDMAGRTYRYLESKPLFPFGFGLSYTTFRYGDATLVRGKGKKNQMNMELKVPVTNAGPVDGDEVVQVYVKKVEDAGGPQRALRGFRRVSIPAGQTVEVSIPLTEMSFRTFNEKTGKMEATAGNYVIYYGKSSDPDDLKQVSVKL